MADTRKATKSAGLTRGKAILIAVLAVVLVVVLYIQFGGAASSSAPMPSTARRRPASAVVPAAKAAAEKKAPSDSSATQAIAVVDKTRWKSPDLAQVVKYDPFALPASFPQPAMAERVTAGSDATAAADDERARRLELVQKQWMEWEDLKRTPVQVIVRGGDQYVAVMGDRTLHVGDEIYGFTVTSIDSRGVQVERKAEP
ncbi:MAG: hypothetical protein U0805_14190 [Pirellulales bacterium]